MPGIGIGICMLSIWPLNIGMLVIGMLGIGIGMPCMLLCIYH